MNECLKAHCHTKVMSSVVPLKEMDRGLRFLKIEEKGDFLQGLRISILV